VGLSNVSVSGDLRTAAFDPLKGGLVVSCQVPDGTPIDTPEFIAAQALTVLQAGAIGIRAQGIANVSAIAKTTNVPIIGLIKRYLDSTPVFICPTEKDVLELEEAGASIVAIDATERKRPNGVGLAEFLSQLRLDTKIPILADVDTLEAALVAESLGCEAVATTLSGYTDKPAPPLPNLRLVEAIAKKVKIPVIAEGGFSRPEHLKQAFEAGAWSVCIGTAITNPYLLTKSFIEVID
jgi:N-acylglucosamine-6-phosphate 2-epimerase